jgi:protein subunit release factor A
MEKTPLFTLTKKDFRVDTFRSGGKGGQHQNKVESGVRITHIETGISAESREFKSQLQNRKAAFNRLVALPKFKIWLHRKAYEIEHGRREIERAVDAWMSEENLLIEYGVIE